MSEESTQVTPMVSPCLVCEKPLTHEHDFPDVVYDGGYMVIHMAYGSIHDTGSRGYDGALAGCQEVHAYLCDQCFETKQHLFRGYAVTKRRPTYTVKTSPTINVQPVEPATVPPDTQSTYHCAHCGACSVTYDPKTKTYVCADSACGAFYYVAPFTSRNNLPHPLGSMVDYVPEVAKHVALLQRTHGHKGMFSAVVGMIVDLVGKAYPNRGYNPHKEKTDEQAG